MADTLELRLGGMVDGRFVTAKEIDYAEIRPLIDQIFAAALIEAGIDASPQVSRRPKRRPRGGPKPERTIRPVRLALVEAFTPTVKQEFGAIYRFVVGSETEQAMSRITAGLAGISNNQLVPEAAEKVRQGINRAIHRGLSVQLENGVATPTFSKANPPPNLDVYPTRQFDSEIAARVVRVGGVQPTARVRLLGSGQDVTLQLTGAKAARELGHHLYRDAILTGSGEWVIDPVNFYAPTRLLKFKVASYQLLDDTTMDAVIEEMTEATGGIWDGVDPVDMDQD